MVTFLRLFPVSGRPRLELIRKFSATICLSQQRADKLVLGCGSNVIDHIYNVKVVPHAGDKGFFLSPFKALETKLIGGVTLNHLAWAALGGVPTGLLALQGEDDLGHFLRGHLKDLQLRTEFVQVDKNFSTAQCHVFIQEDGERSILMAPAATSQIKREAVTKYFDDPIREHASMVTTEISQVPLSGVLALLESAKKANVLSVLDLDIPPSVAEKEAKLGCIEDVIECVKMADILKPTKSAAEELMAIMTGDESARTKSHKEMATELAHLCDSKLVAITNGSQPSTLATKENMTELAPFPVHKVLDTTGAGDAFLGGLIVGITNNGLPKTTEDLSELGRIANAYGATCVQSVGGVPVQSSAETLQKYLPETNISQTQTPAEPTPIEKKNKLEHFQQSLKNDAKAASRVAAGLDMEIIEKFVDALEQCEGELLISGVGKSGHVGQRFASSLSSVGMPAHFVHATEWVHGDLGKARGGRDVVMFLSHSGNTEECVRGAYHLVAKGVCTLSITGGKDSKLSKLSTFTLNYSKDGLHEPFGCLPSATVVLQEMLCNALLIELIDRKGVTKDTYKQNHPGGNIGIVLSRN